MAVKLIDILNELNDTQAADALSQAIEAPSVSDFVSKFKTIAADPKVQAILRAGRTDGIPNDEKIPYTKSQVKVDSLIPTQSEIGFDQSIQNILTDQYGSLASIFAGQADVGGPIVTYNGKYIIDGHHRWSQVFAANPKASMEALNITGNLKPEEILKIVHAAIAVKLGEVPSSDPKGINILKGVTEQQVLDAVNSKLTDKAKELWAKHGQADNESIAKYIYNNLESLINKHKPISGAPGRKDMPQTDAGDKDMEKTLSFIKNGVVNYKDPKHTDVKDIKEIKRLQKLAGIK